MKRVVVLIARATEHSPRTPLCGGNESQKIQNIESFAFIVADHIFFAETNT
jgi:hypothetical protein